MRGISLAIGIVLSAVFLFGAGQDKTEGASDARGQAALQKVCSGCHELDVITSNRFTQTGWQEKVDDMISKGASATDEEVTGIIAYLTKNYGKVNINTATQAQLLDELGLTDKEAQAIVAYREHTGKIKDFEELKTVPGLSAGKLQEKRSMIAYAQ